MKVSLREKNARNLAMKVLVRGISAIEVKILLTTCLQHEVATIFFNIVTWATRNDHVSVSFS